MSAGGASGGSTPRIYIGTVENQEPTQLDRIETMLTHLCAQLDRFRPILDMFAPGNGASDVQRAGVLRGMRKAARNGS